MRNTKLVLLVAVIIALVAALATGCAPKEKPATDGNATSATATGSGASGSISVFVPCGALGPYLDLEKLVRTTDPNLAVTSKVANVAVLTKALVNGKEACDVFLALGDIEVQSLEKAGKVARAVPVAGNSIGLIVNKTKSAGIKSIKDLASPKIKTIAVATSNNTLGFAAEEAFRKAGIWDQVQPKLVRPDMPDQVRTYVSNGQADAGIIYGPCLSEVHKPGEAKGAATATASTKIDIIGVIDTSLYTPFNLNAVVMKDAVNPAGAEAFVKAMLSPEGQTILKDWKYGPIAEAAPAKAGG